MLPFEPGGGGSGGLSAGPGSIVQRQVRRPPSRRTLHAGTVTLAIIAERAIIPRGRMKRRPDAIVEAARTVRLASKTKRSEINSASTGAQLAFTNDRNKTQYWPSEIIKLVVG